MSIEIGDCRVIMRRWIGAGVRVQMCVTSPPYWGLRDYGCAGQLGLEPTPEEYVANMVEVFGLVRELLADDGTLWLNLGDSYVSVAGSQAQGANGQMADRSVVVARAQVRDGKAVHDAIKRPPSVFGIRPKNLVGIPWRVAFALQADGWYLRSEIIWAKPNPMPESVRDRPTKSHEQIFLLSKRSTYYYDADAIAEASIYAGEQLGIVRGTKRRAESMGVNPSGNEKPGADADIASTRNKRSVWTIATQPYAEAHFATFPPALVEPCVIAGSRVGDVVLDPFMGSGTVAQVAQALGRRYLGCELNPDYAKFSDARTAQPSMVFA